LCAPVVDRGTADVGAFGKPGLGLALPGEGRLDQFEEWQGWGVVAHTFMCTEMTRVPMPLSLPRIGKSRIELASVGKSTKGVSDLYLTRAQACGRLDISPPTLAKHIRNGDLAAIKLGDARNSPVRVLIASIEAYEDRKRITTGTRSAA
jgi:hypothetical protein